MKNRIVVHIALNAENERVGTLVEVAGRLIHFFGDKDLNSAISKPTFRWMNAHYGTVPTVSYWKSFSKKVDQAVRFQRVMLVGGAA